MRIICAIFTARISGAYGLCNSITHRDGEIKHKNEQGYLLEFWRALLAGITAATKHMLACGGKLPAATGFSHRQDGFVLFLPRLQGKICS
jgi:hypothetical protein